jgi:2-dehydro-3-deoxy-D-arabinonate dehydratase
MQIGKVWHDGRKRVVVHVEDQLRLLPGLKKGGRRLSEILHAPNPSKAVVKLLKKSKPAALVDITWLAPIGRQEVWAAGVTYQRSKSARQEESEGASQFYDAVYKSPRPELFFKAAGHRVVGHHQLIRIRQDSQWNVPEPELTLVINPDKQIVGYTIGNDVSSREIEGANPLYLPQAKVYDGSCALGPLITLAQDGIDPEEWAIRLTILRQGVVAFEGSTQVSQMARELPELVDWLGREMSFPDGCFLLTGTGIVPPEDFTLQSGDVVEIAIDRIGTLVNTVM